MPKSLDTGVSSRVPIKVPAAEKQALIDVLRDGETVSALTRELWRKEVARRLKAACRNPLLSKDFTETITE